MRELTFSELELVSGGGSETGVTTSGTPTPPASYGNGPTSGAGPSTAIFEGVMSSLLQTAGGIGGAAYTGLSTFLA